MPRGRYQQKQWDEREAAILDALETLSLAQGFASVTMDDLAEAVGISKATLYQHFTSKDAMLAALMARRTAAFITWLEASVGQPPLERLRQTMQYLMGDQLQPLRGVITLGRDDVLPVFENDPALVAGHTRVLELLAAIVQAGQADGTIAPDLSAAAIISAMWALSHVSLGHGALPATSAARLASGDHAAHMLRLFARSIRPAAAEE